MTKSETCCPTKAAEPANRENENASAENCCKQAPPERPGYSLYPFVNGWLDSPAGKIPQVSTRLGIADHRGRWAMRWGIGRSRYQITPGLYAVGRPDSLSPVLVSANYKFSFDCLRSAMQDFSAWILVLDTKGVNVWCAAGKGTFGTDEIIHRCQTSQLEKIISHKNLIVPQLGAPGVAAHKVRQATGFNIIYGPVRATDIPAFFAAGMQATSAMRRVTFSTRERLILAPVELTGLRKTFLYTAILLFLLSGIGPGFFSFAAAWERGSAAILCAVAGTFSGAILTPALLPWLPGRMFAVKGALSGVAISTVLYLSVYRQASITEVASLYLFIAAVASYTAMNFTGSSTFTSPSGVEKEMRRSIPLQACALLTAGILWLSAAF